MPTHLTDAAGDLPHSDLDPLLLTTREAAKRLSLDQAALRSLIATGQLEAVRVGQVERVPIAALHALVLDLRQAPVVQPAWANKAAWGAKDVGRLLTPAEVSSILSVPVSTLYGWRHQRKGPPAIRVGRHLRWRSEDVEAWIARASRCD